MLMLDVSKDLKGSMPNLSPTTERSTDVLSSEPGTGFGSSLAIGAKAYLKKLVKRVGQDIQVFRELIPRLLNLDLEFKDQSRRKKYKAAAFSLLIPLLLALVRVAIKGHYQDFVLWFGVSVGLGIVTVLLYFWFFERWIDPKSFFTLGLLPAITVVLYSYFVNVLFSFSLRRVAFASLYIGFLAIFVVLLYITFLGANILIVSMYKQVGLARLAENVLLFLLVLNRLLIDAVGFLYFVYRVADKPEFWAVYAVLNLLWGWIVLLVWFYYVKNLKEGGLVGIFAAVLGAVLGLWLYAFVGNIYASIWAMALFPWFLWETIQLTVGKTRVRNWLLISLLWILGVIVLA